MDCSTPGLSVHHQLPKLTQTLVHGVGDAFQPSHPLSSPSPPAFNVPQHQGLFKWVSSSHQVAKVGLHGFNRCMLLNAFISLRKKSCPTEIKAASQKVWALVRLNSEVQHERGSSTVGQAQLRCVFGHRLLLLAWGVTTGWDSAGAGGASLWLATLMGNFAAAEGERRRRGRAERVMGDPAGIGAARSSRLLPPFLRDFGRRGPSG